MSALEALSEPGAAGAAAGVLPSTDVDYERRFGGIARLYGQAALQRFADAQVCVIGVGGVGSWTVEALARSAVGHLTLIDLDHVAESNINRQIHALDSTLGQAKVQALAERIGQINPRCKVECVEEFIDPDNLQPLIGDGRFDVVVDAIDSVRAKVALVAFCRERAIPLISIGAAGGQIDPTRVRVADLAHTEHEPLLAKVRKRLRTQHGFPRNIKMKFGIDAVFSDEPLTYPRDADGAACSLDGDESAAHASVTGLNCAGFGSTVAVTAVFGLVAAAQVLKRLMAPAATSDPAP